MNHKNLQIFIVEDDELYGLKLKNWLDKVTYNVKVFSTAEDAIEPITNEKPSIIILDNLLPNLKGREVIELYKLCSPNTAVILMSSIYTIEEIAKSIQNKADFLFNKNELTQTQLLNIIDTAQKQKGKKNGLWTKIASFTNKLTHFETSEVVIVDDDEIFATHLKQKIIQTNEIFQVKIFTSVDDFYKYSEKNNPKLVFLDYFFPNSNGEDVLAFIKNVLPKTKVIIVSSQKDPNIALKLKSMGIYNYILKNDDWKENLTKIMLELEAK